LPPNSGPNQIAPTGFYADKFYIHRRTCILSPMFNRLRNSSNQTRDLLATLAVMALAATLRLPGLTVFLTADEARSWLGRSIIFLDSLLAGNLANTGPGGAVDYIQNVSLSPAPGVTTMWTGAIGLALAYLWQAPGVALAQFLRQLPFDPLDPALLFWLRLPGVALAVAAVGLTCWWSRPLLGWWGAVMAAGLLALDPFHLALSRVLGHDALVTTFMWLSLLAFLRVIWDIEHTHHPAQFKPPASHLTWLLISGDMGGLAFLSKYPALFMGAFTALALLLVYARLARRGSSPGMGWLITWWLRDIIIWSAAAGLVCLLFWPAMWLNPLAPAFTIITDALRAAGSAHQKGSFFLGQPVPDPGALFYPLVAAFRTTPLVLLGALLALGQLVKPRSGQPDGRPPRLFPLILLAYIGLYTLLVTYGGKKQDRYLLPALPALDMLAAMGYAALLNALRRRDAKPGWLGLVPAGVVLGQLALVLPYYPYYFSYYNPLMGGGAAAAQTIQVGWGEGLNEAADFLNARPGSAQAKVTSWYSTTFEPYFNGHAIYKIDDDKISRSPKPGLAADYVVFYINQTQRRLPSDGVLAFFQRAKPLHTVVLNGLPYAWIYPAPGLPHIITGEARLVGQAELLGFDWQNAAGQRLEAIPSNSAATLRLYWEWQGKAASDPIGLSLVDAGGNTVGWGNLINPGQPITATAPLSADDGAIVISDYALAVFPGTPPGEYYLRAWIDRPATGEVIGQFPLAPADAAVTVAPPLSPVPAADFEIRHPVNEPFGPLQLPGYNFNAEPWEPGQSRQLELFWAGGQPNAPATAQLKLMPLAAGIPPETAPVWSRAITPGYPPNRWQPGDTYRDIWPLELPRATPNGNYSLQLQVGGVTRTIGQIRVSGRERLFTPPPVATPLAATTADDSIRLLGFTATPGPAALAVTLVWQANHTPPEDYTVFVQLLNANNQLVAQHDSPPQNGAAPTGSWATGEVVVDEHALALPANLPGGSYRLIAGLYRPADGQRLPISTDSSAAGDALPLATIELK